LSDIKIYQADEENNPSGFTASEDAPTIRFLTGPECHNARCITPKGAPRSNVRNVSWQLLLQQQPFKTGALSSGEAALTGDPAEAVNKILLKFRAVNPKACKWAQQWRRLNFVDSSYH